MTDTFRITCDDDPASTHARIAGGRSGKPTRTVMDHAKTVARRLGYPVHVWREEPEAWPGTLVATVAP